MAPTKTRIACRVCGKKSAGGVNVRPYDFTVEITVRRPLAPMGARDEPGEGYEEPVIIASGPGMFRGIPLCDHCEIFVHAEIEWVESGTEGPAFCANDYDEQDGHGLP